MKILRRPLTVNKKYYYHTIIIRNPSNKYSKFKVIKLLFYISPSYWRLQKDVDFVHFLGPD